MAKEGDELWAYSAQGSCSAQDVGLQKTAKDAANNLVCLLGLAVSLRVKPEERLADTPTRRQNSFQNLRNELGSTVRDNVRGETVYPKNMLDNDLGCLFGRGELR